jgi:ABC-type spermidine/putrescine transport system permease subunit II
VRVTGPLVRSGIVSGAALVFLTVMKELPVTLLLRPIGFDTLATRIWSATADGFWTRAAGPALLLIVLSGLSMLLINAGQRKHDPHPPARSSSIGEGEQRKSKAVAVRSPISQIGTGPPKSHG